MIQFSPVPSGLCDNPAQSLNLLFEEMVSFTLTAGLPAAGREANGAIGGRVQRLVRPMFERYGEVSLWKAHTLMTPLN